MELQTEVRANWKILKPLEKRLDAYVAQGFKEALVKAAGDGSKQIIIDLSNVEVIDSSGLGSLVFFKQFAGEEARIVIASASASVVSILKLTHLDRVFNIVDKPQEVLEKVSQPVIRGKA